MSRDKEIRRQKDAARQPVRKTETDVRAGEMRGQDFDLRRARDAPVQEDNRHKGRNLYQGASEGGTVPAADSGVDFTASRQASGDSVPDSRSDPQESGPDFSGRDSFRESRQQDSGHSDSGRFRRQDADFSRRGGQELSGSGSSEVSASSEAGSTNAGETPSRRRMEQKKTLFEQLGVTYHEESGYLIPDLRLPENEERTIGLFGQWHLDYLKQYRRVTYINLLTSGKLNAYLAEIDRQAQKRLERLIQQMKQAQGITEQLKAENALEWTGRMNNIRACAMEIVNREIIYA